MTHVERWSRRLPVASMLALCTFLACSSDPGSNPNNDGGGGGGDGGANPQDGSAPGPDGTSPLPDGAPPTASKAKLLTQKLGGGHANHFLVGVGNDGTNNGNDDAYNLGVTLDLHYHYLTGIHSSGGWTTWNSNPDYAGKRIRESRGHGQVTMLTVYMMASWGDGNIKAELESAQFMADWFADWTQLLATIKAENDPVVLHVEPDFWGYVQQQGVTKALVSQSKAAECGGQPDTIAGFGKCLVAMTRARAPNAVLGFHASVWSTNMDTGSNTNPNLDVAAEAAKTVAFFKASGLDQADFVATDVSDRDAGCYEAGHAPMCAPKRTNVYWDEANVALPNFKQHFKWASALTTGLDLPLIWWQIPYGSPSGAPGGAVGAWRDNRVHYFFAHVGELVAAGGVGAAWGVGAGDQTYLTNEFKTAVKGYFGSPFPLP